MPDSGGQTKGSYYDSGLGLASIIKPPFSSKWALYLEIQNMLSSFKPMKVTLSSKISWHSSDGWTLWNVTYLYRKITDVFF